MAKTASPLQSTARRGHGPDRIRAVSDWVAALIRKALLTKAAGRADAHARLPAQRRGASAAAGTSRRPKTSSSTPGAKTRKRFFREGTEIVAP